ncbi:metal ABC transporter substrate-binding protein [Clostridium tetani]|uniref:metal ABC transporter substrate-binding protein n=1 Tax=Clostridium tetani TaxID=1513 RepID=UPI00100B4616|nr:zinc ABC transporter substrate-binding protein [Clostridium tetani]RXI45656.1 zinc ABC transporter substrate-binding protein [Clostridium tetani]RXM60650.1 zinc ABC transporter substrate-binding protein [Clostridium tetani]
MKKVYRFITLIIIMLMFSSCFSKGEYNPTETLTVDKLQDENLSIVVTDKLLYYMTRKITEERHFVEYIFKDRNIERDFKATKDNLNNVSKGDLFIYNGLDVEPWFNEFTNKLNKNKVGVINISRGINLINYTKERKYNGNNISRNPYYWMNIDNYKIALLNIKNSIQDKDPKNRDYYERNFQKEVKGLQELEKMVSKIKIKLKEYTIYYEEEDLEYFTRYLGMNSIKLKENKEENNLLLEKSKNKDKIIFLYNDLQKNKEYDDLIKTHKIKSIRVLFLNESANYIDTLKHDLKILGEV